MRGDHLVRHIHSHYDIIPKFMSAERRKDAVERRIPIVSNRVGPEAKPQFALCLVCKKGATYWTHDKPVNFLKAHLKQSPQCFDASAFETVRHLFDGEECEDEEDHCLEPSVKKALDAAVAYEADDEDEDDDAPKTVNEKVGALIKQYDSAIKNSLKRLKEVNRLKDEVELTREMMRLYRRAATRYRRGERLYGTKRSIAIARRDLARLRGRADTDDDTDDLSSASDRSDGFRRQPAKRDEVCSMKFKDV